MIQDWRRIQLGELSLHPADLLLIRGAMELNLLTASEVWVTLKSASREKLTPADASATNCSNRLAALTREAWSSVSADEAFEML